MFESVAFFTFAAVIIWFAVKVITSTNPVHSALFLVLTMIGLAGAFFQLNAQFIAGVQLIVYAGAVMVLFVMVLMLFDLQNETAAFAKGALSGALKVAASAAIGSFLVGSFLEASQTAQTVKVETLPNDSSLTRDLAILLYSKYALAFEVLGVLLLVVAVGVVSLSRVKGGTHAKH